VLRRGSDRINLNGRDPAIGGRHLAVRAGGSIRLFRRGTLDPLADLPGGDANALAVSNRWLAWRTREDGRDVIRARRIDDLDPVRDSQLVQSAGKAKSLGAPAVFGDRIVYALATRRRNVIRRERLKGGKAGTLAASREAALTTPSLTKGALLYVRIGDKRQRLMLKRFGGGSRRLYSRKARGGTLWSTSLTAKRAYATLLKGSNTRIISVKR
jgi:hypothetical protein